LFGDKEALQLATLNAAVEVFRTKVIAPSTDEMEPVKRLQALCDNWYGYVRQRVFPGGCMLYGTLSEYRAKPGIIQDQVNHHRHAWTKLLSLTVKQAQQRCQIRVEIEVDQMIFELTSFQAAANIAFILGDQSTFLRAHRTSRERIADSISGP
jgi:hypothetical protein